MRWKLLLIILPILVASSVNLVFAESIELTVSGNGSDSSSAISATDETSVTVQQSNTADISSNVDVSANTGNNEAEGNSGDTIIQTGNIDASTIVENENINVNVSDNKSASVDVNATIVNNGAGSTNIIDSLTQTLFESSQTNMAHIINNVFIQANTGHNVASYNNGDVVIKTGDIKAQTEIVNRDVNQSLDPHDLVNSINLSIADNGSNSTNSISFSFDTILNVTSWNKADIDNNAVHDLNTGLNTTIGNNGSVLIKTGDILSMVKIANEGINVSVFSPFVPVGQGPDVPFGGYPPTENPAVLPTIIAQAVSQNGDGGNSGDKDNGGAGGSSAVSGIALPATGNYFMFLLTLASLITFLTGWYLRLRAGRSPNFAYVYA